MSAGRTSRLVPLVLLLGVAAVNFLWMPADLLPGDPHAWREEARRIVAVGQLSVPREQAEMGEPGQYFVQNTRNGLYYTKWGVANALFMTPPLLLEQALGRDLAKPDYRPSLFLANLWNVALSVALAAVLYALSGAYSSRPAVRVLFVIASLYCTSLWFYQRAQGSELIQTLLFSVLFVALLGFLRPLRERGASALAARAWGWLALAWLCAAVLVFLRVANGLLLPLIVLLGAWFAAEGRSWRELRAARLAAALLVPPALILAGLGMVNHAKFGAFWLTGYHQWMPEMHLPNGRLADGLWGFLFSPRFSIFSHFPLLVFALVALRRFVERHRLEAVVMLSIAGTFLLVLSKIPTWHGEFS
jgi:hypothetical protein